MAFCDALTKKERNIPNGWKFSLPTEAQWEYACIAGTTTEYSWGDEIDIKVGKLYKKCFRENKQRLVLYQSSPWGFFDMHGNVWEWCADLDRYQRLFSD